MSPPCRARIAERLAAAGCVAAEEEADELLAAGPDAPTLEGWLRRRERGEPLAWITGTVNFCGRPVRVDPGVYVPRYETEELARRAARCLQASADRMAVELCAGSGAVAAYVAATVPDAVVIGVDRDPRATRCCRRNGVASVTADLGGPLRSRAFDVVAAVAPYVPTDQLAYLPIDVQRYEPRLALDGGPDGLHTVRRVAQAAARLLRPGGFVLLELGASQDRLLAPTLAEAGFAQVETWTDEDGDLRGLAAQRGSRRMATSV